MQKLVALRMQNTSDTISLLIDLTNLEKYIISSKKCLEAPNVYLLISIPNHKAIKWNFYQASMIVTINFEIMKSLQNILCNSS